jgi:hypothetical protein
MIHSFVDDRQIFLNGTTWKFDKEEAGRPLLPGERVHAFKDPENKSVCVKFVQKKRWE